MLIKKLIYSSLLLPVVTLASPVQVTLSNGDQLIAELIEHTETTLTVSHSILGTLAIDNGGVVALSELEKEPPVVVVEEKVKQSHDNGLIGTGLLKNWSRQLDIGISGSAGKSKNQKINIGFDTEFSDESTRISSKTAFYSASSEDERTDSSFYSTINRDWLQADSPWFSFTGGRFDWDEFKDWDYRVNANGGLGYQFVNHDSYLLLARIGLNANQTIGGEREEFTPEGLLGVESKWLINNHQRITFANTFYPSLKDTSEFRNLSSLDWKLDLNTVNGVALKLALINEYDSSTEGDISKNDFKYTASLAWQL